MKKFAIPMLALFMLVLSSCGEENNLDKLNGKWKMDVDATLKNAAIEKDQLSQAVAKSMFEAMAVTVDIDAKTKQITINMGKNKMAGSFTVVSDSGKKITITDNYNKNMIFEFINADSVLMRDGSDKDKRLFIQRVK